MVVHFACVVAEHDLIEIPSFPLFLTHLSGDLRVPQRCFERRSSRARESSKSSTEGSVYALRHGLVELTPEFRRYPGILTKSLGIGASDTVGLTANVVIKIDLVRRQLHPLDSFEVFFDLEFILEQLLR